MHSYTQLDTFDDLWLLVVPVGMVEPLPPLVLVSDTAMG
jgi:hypothetical protein